MAVTLKGFCFIDFHSLFFLRCITDLVCCEAADGANPVDVPYRYSVSPTSSGKCNVYKPTALPEDQAARPGLKVCSLLVFLPLEGMLPLARCGSGR